jgi:hypothetical protein
MLEMAAAAALHRLPKTTLKLIELRAARDR